jgi:hypothetical protein
MKRKQFTVVSSVVACLMVVGGSPLSAQRVAHDTAPLVIADTSRPASHALRSALIWPAATIGAGAGLYLGGLFGMQLDWGGSSEDPGWESILLFAGIGSALGGAAGAYAVDHHMGIGTALAGGLLGVAGGYAGAAVSHKLMGDGGGPVLVGYTVSAGLVNSVVAAAVRKRHHH